MVVGVGRRPRLTFWLTLLAKVICNLLKKPTDLDLHCLPLTLVMLNKLRCHAHL